MTGHVGTEYLYRMEHLSVGLKKPRVKVFLMLRVHSFDTFLRRHFVCLIVRINRHIFQNSFLWASFFILNGKHKGIWWGTIFYFLKIKHTLKISYIPNGKNVVKMALLNITAGILNYAIPLQKHYGGVLLT